MVPGRAQSRAGLADDGNQIPGRLYIDHAVRHLAVDVPERATISQPESPVALTDPAGGSRN